jgi:putative glutamine amidotransferase
MRSVIKTLLCLLCFGYILFIMPGCSNKNTGNNITIAISKGGPEENYKAYGEWLQKNNPSIKWMDLSQMTLDKAVSTLEKCSGLLLSGGGDVNPAKYSRPDQRAICEDIDDNRDTLELALIKKAMELKMPILAICRGHQILNVYQGGTLVPDISSFPGMSVQHRCEDKIKCFHSISISDGSILKAITGQSSAIVNSSHHQAVAILASPFKVTALSTDGMMEAFEWKDTLDRSPLLSVQWHPERLPDSLEIMSRSIAQFFLSKAISYSQQQK